MGSSDADRIALEVQLTDSSTGPSAPSSPVGTQPSSSPPPTDDPNALIKTLVSEIKALSADKQKAPPTPPPVAPPVVKPPASPSPADSPAGKPLGSLATFGKRALPSFASAGVTSVTGSPSLGGMAGTAASSALEGGALASMAGPLGIAAAVVTITSEINNKIAEGFNKLTLNTANLATSPNPADPLGMAGGALSEASTFVDPLQKAFGINLNLLDDAFRSLVDAVGITAKNFDVLGDKMQRYSGPVAVAKAEEEVRKINLELYRSEQLGPQMAQFIRARTSGEEAFEKLKISLQREFLPLLTTLTTAVTSVVEAIGPAIKSIAKMGMDTVRKILGALPLIGPAMEAFIDWVNEQKRKSDEEARKEASKFKEEIDKFLDPGRALMSGLPTRTRGPSRPTGTPGTGGP